MRTEVLIVGSGVAALSAALSAAPRRVLLLTPGELGRDGASHWAQGGIAAAMGADDSPACHAADTLAAGAGHADPARVATLTAAAPAMIEWLQGLGARFDLDAAGRLCLGREAAHSHARVVHARGDATGAELMRALGAALRCAAHVEIRQRWTARGLLHDERGVAGVLAEDGNGQRHACVAPQVVLATGGIGQLFRYSTNPPRADGSGLAMALEVGAELRDLEFVQFHPTALVTGELESAPLPLLTEALRGAGAVLVDGRGRRFMAEVPGAELASRDVVARAVYRQLRLGAVYLDARAAVGAALPQRYPSVYALCMSHGFDPRTELLPIAPAVHYHMGGIAVDELGQSSVEGLYAVGEVACSGVHGANRLASNSLLEGLAFGRLCGQGLRAKPAPRWPAAVHAPAAAPPPGRMDAAQAQRLRHLLWDCVGIERSTDGMARGADGMREIASRALPGSQLAARAAVSLALLAAARARPVSLGAHCIVEPAAVTRERPADEPASAWPDRSRHAVCASR